MFIIQPSLLNSFLQKNDTWKIICVAVAFSDSFLLGTWNWLKLLSPMAGIYLTNCLSSSPVKNAFLGYLAEFLRWFFCSKHITGCCERVTESISFITAQCVSFMNSIKLHGTSLIKHFQGNVVSKVSKLTWKHYDSKELLIQDSTWNTLIIPYSNIVLYVKILFIVQSYIMPETSSDCAISHRECKSSKQPQAWDAEMCWILCLPYCVCLVAFS